jgi:hypothetical protein
MTGIKTDTREHDELVLEARARLERQGEKFAILLGHYDAGLSFVGVGLALLATTYGAKKAADFLRGCADDLEAEASTTEGRA